MLSRSADSGGGGGGVRRLGRLLADAEVAAVRLDAIDLNDETLRFRNQLDVEGLAESIRRHGQLTPVILRRRAGRPHQIVCGFRRIGALRTLGQETVVGVLVSVSESQALELCIMDNQVRRSLSDLDRARAVIEAQRVGMSYPEMERLFGVTVRQLRRIRALSSLPEVLRLAVAEGRLTATHATRLAQLERQYPGLDLAHWIAVVRRRRLSVRAMARAVRAQHGRISS